MNLKKIQEALQQYKNFLRANLRQLSVYKWESLQIFQQRWDIEAEDFKAMYDQSLQNSHTRRLWKRENYEPKQMMLKFIEGQPDYVRFLFKDLFREKAEVEGRVGRFIFHCDELLREYKQAHPRSIENNHFHDDNYQMVSLYLAFRYPENYAPYDFEKFKKLLKLLGSKDLPKVNEVARFYKVMRTLYQFLEKDEELIQLHQRRLLPGKHFQGKSLLLVEDFYRYLTGG